MYVRFGSFFNTSAVPLCEHFFRVMSSRSATDFPIGLQRAISIHHASINGAMVKQHSICNRHFINIKSMHGTVTCVAVHNNYDN